jgi:hypothetical protein
MMDFKALSMMFCEKRYPLFGIMLVWASPPLSGKSRRDRLIERQPTRAAL